MCPPLAELWEGCKDIFPLHTRYNTCISCNGELICAKAMTIIELALILSQLTGMVGDYSLTVL